MILWRGNDKRKRSSISWVKDLAEWKEQDSYTTAIQKTIMWMGKTTQVKVLTEVSHGSKTLRSGKNKIDTEPSEDDIVGGETTLQCTLI